MNRKLLIGIVVAVLALLLAGGAAFASPSVRDQLGIAPQATAAPAPDTTQTNRNGKQHGKGAQLAGLLVRATADVTGLQPKDVVQELRAGKSLAQIAQEHGKSSDDIVKAARTKLEDRLKQAVTNGRLTQQRADTTLATFDKTAPTIMNDATLGQQLGQRGGSKLRLGSALVKATADVTGLQPKDVLQELRGGKSLAQIAQEHGKSGDDILAKLREQGQQRLDKALDRAKGLLNQPGLRGGSQSPSSGATNG